MICNAWHEAEEVFVERLDNSDAVKNPRKEYDVDGMIEACKCTVVRDGVEVTVWYIPDDHDRFWEIASFYMYPGVDEYDTAKTGDGQFTARYRAVTDRDGMKSRGKLKREFTGTLREIIEDAEIELQSEGKNFAYSQLLTGVTDDYGNGVRGWRWFTDDKETNSETNSLNGIATDNEARLVAYQGGQRIVLHRYPMPVYPDAVEQFIINLWDSVNISGVAQRFFELERV